MAKFKVGDVVIANDEADAHYSITRDGWTGIVKEIKSNNTICVVPADDPDRSIPFEVNPDCFDHYDADMYSIKNNQLLVYLLEDKFDQIIAFLKDIDTNGDKDIYSSIAAIMYDLPYADCLGLDSQTKVNPEGYQRRNNVRKLLRSLTETCNKELKDHK